MAVVKLGAKSDDMTVITINFIFITLQGPVIRRPISADQWLKLILTLVSFSFVQKHFSR